MMSPVIWIYNVYPLVFDIYWMKLFFEIFADLKFIIYIFCTLRVKSYGFLMQTENAQTDQCLQYCHMP